MTITAHPDFASCLFVSARDSLHAWALMRALDAAGFVCGYPALTGTPGLAVTGQIDDAEVVAKVRAVALAA